MSTRAQLQTKSIAELRAIAEAVGVESDGLQKSRLISALMAAGGVTDDGEESSMVDLPTATPRNDDGRGSDFSAPRRTSDQRTSDRTDDLTDSGENSSDRNGDGESETDEGSAGIDTSDSS